MAFSVSAADGVRIASGGLMVVVGALLMRAGRGGRSSAATGIGHMFCGAGVIGLFTNFDSDEALPWVVNALAAAAGYAIGIVGVLRLLRDAAGSGWWRTYGVLGAALSLVACSGLLLFGLDAWTPKVFGLLAGSPYGVSSLYVGFLVTTTFFALCLVLALAWARRGIPGFSPAHSVVVAAAIMAWPYWAAINTSRQAANFVAPMLSTTENAGLVLMVIGYASMAVWAIVAWGARGRAAWFSLGMPSLVAGILVARVAFGDIGPAGITRLFGAAVVAHLVLRRDALGLGVRTSAMQRGGLATLSIATLLIVAQVAQNFLSAQYGLLMGGLVAGALLVAARPIERALEGRQATPATVLDNERGSSYRAALRRYLRDGVVTREEELDLARLARHLGLRHEDALRARHEVEDELRAGGS